MFLGRGPRLNEAEVAAVYAEGGDLPAEVGLEPRVISEPSHRLTDLPIGAIALVVSGAAQARRVIAASMPEGTTPNSDVVTAAVFELIETFGVGTVPTPEHRGEAA